MKPLLLATGQKASRSMLLDYIKEKDDPISGITQRLLGEAFITFMKDRDYLNTVVIDLGSYNRRFYPRAVNIDLFEGDTDVITDISKPLPIESNTVDFVACTAVLEHISHPNFVVSEIYRILRKGGEVWSDIPFMQPYYASPDDFQRYTISGIKQLFHEFTEISVGVGYPNGYSIMWLLDRFRAISFTNQDLPNANYPNLNALFEEVTFNKIRSELQQMDLALVNKYNHLFPINMHEIANALYFHGKKG